MVYAHRFWLYAPVAALLALVVAICVYWYTTATAFDRRLTSGNGHEIAPGITLHYDHKEIGGFPFRIDAVLSGVTLGIATERGTVVWQSQHFALHRLDYGASHLIFEAAGMQQVRWRDRTGRTRVLAFTPALLRGSVLGRSDRVERLDVALYGAATPDFRLDHGEFHLRRDASANGYDLYLLADQLKLPSHSIIEAGVDLTKLRLAAMIGPMAPWQMQRSAPQRPLASTIAAAHRTLTIASLDLGWRMAAAHGSGWLTLDTEGRPFGLLHLTVTGTPPTTPRQPHGILAALLRARKNSDTMPIALALQDGLAYLNQVPVGFVEPLL